MQRSVKCRQHEVLRGRLRADTKVYVEVTRRLESCKTEDFEQTYRAAESARLAFLRAREALKVHITTSPARVNSLSPASSRNSPNSKAV
jgi:hypothetical protein